MYCTTLAIGLLALFLCIGVVEVVVGDCWVVRVLTDVTLIAVVNTYKTQKHRRDALRGDGLKTLSHGACCGWENTL